MANILLCFLLLLLPLAGSLHANFGFDVGRRPEVALEQFFDPFSILPEEGAWLRMRPVARQLPADWRPGDLAALLAFDDPEYLGEIEGLVELRARGFKLAAGMLHLGGPERWPSGVREGPDAPRRLPLDLRKAYWRAFAAGFLYAGLFDVWEIENEPDIGFVADNAHVYASFFKAYSLGLRDGEAARGKGFKGASARAKVVMAALAMPPGPYFEEISRNRFWGYTDGFNYHYYGYPEDFRGVYWQFEDALVERSPRLDLPALRNPRLVRRSWGGLNRLRERDFPVFLTEYGYGYLTPEAAATEEGRLAQLDWFRQVLPQIGELAIEGPMAFYLPPYTGPTGIEFGLTHPERIGGRLDQPAPPFKQTPALEWMREYARENPYRPRHWKMPKEELSPVVLDFILGAGAEEDKAFQGYFLTRKDDLSAARSRGSGDLVLYNFSGASVRGRLVAELGGRSILEERLILPAKGRVQIPLNLEVSADRLEIHSLDVRFVPDARRIPPARMHTNFWPSPAGMESETTYSFLYPENEVEQARVYQRRRPVGTGEPKLEERDEWFVTPGLTVAETALGWSFQVKELPVEPNRPAMAELPLPGDFDFAPGALLEFYFRTALGTEEGIFEPYFRTANGNLYSVWPRLQATADWQHYLQARENFTMAFHGRANLPWRFSENRPVALVFYLRPETLPFTLEVAFPQIVELRRNR